MACLYLMRKTCWLVYGWGDIQTQTFCKNIEWPYSNKPCATTKKHEEVIDEADCCPICRKYVLQNVSPDAILSNTIQTKPNQTVLCYLTYKNSSLVTYATYTNNRHFLIFNTQISTFCYCGNSSIRLLPLWMNA